MRGARQFKVAFTRRASLAIVSTVVDIRGNHYSVVIPGLFLENTKQSVKQTR
jgi:hypothetical protein